jgi:predicted dehydrogenase
MQTSPASLKLLIAGAGLFGREHLERLVGRTDARVVGAADTRPEALALVRARYGVATCDTDPFRLIDSVDADAIIIATPAASHVEICAHALNRNLCVLLEKPVAPSAASAMTMLDIARKSKGFVLPAHVLRFSKDHRRLVEVVRSGRIGEVIYVNARRYRDDSHAVRYPDTDPTLMTLIHDIDLAQWIAGSDFRSVLSHRSAGPGFRSMTAVRATTATGVICDLRTAWTFKEGDLPEDRLEVVGDRGSVELVVGVGTHTYADGRSIETRAAEADDALRNEHDHFLACILDRSRSPALSLSQAIAGLELADASMESLRLNREIVIA